MQNNVMKTDNELIAEFMRFVNGGDFWSSDGKHYLKSDYSHRFYPSELMFDENFEWLMPVMEKIEIKHLCIIDISIFLGSTTCKIQKQESKTVVWQTVGQSNITIDAIYEAVVEFIKWHNSVTQQVLQKP